MSPCFALQVNGALVFWGLIVDPKNRKNNMSTITKHIKLQIAGDADAVNAAISLLHHLNFINGSIWSQAIRKRGEPSVVRVASRPIEVAVKMKREEEE
jgi:hypothetical protein